jgi:hypothetical protein
MSGATVVRYKWFWVWEDEEKERWLRAMAARGLHLEAVRAMRYVFRSGAPQDVAYRLDFRRARAGGDDYYRLFEDAGWELVSACAGWQFWRKPVQGGREPEIFTDGASRAAMLRRMRTRCTAAMMPSVVLAGNPALWHVYGRSAHREAVMIGIVVLLWTGYGYVLAKLSRRIRALG